MIPREEDKKKKKGFLREATMKTGHVPVHSLSFSVSANPLAIVELTVLSIRIVSAYGEPGGSDGLRTTRGRFLEVSRLMPLSCKHLGCYSSRTPNCM